MFDGVSSAQFDKLTIPFTLAEEKLSVFTNRFDQELPDLCVLVRSNTIADDFVVTGKNKKSSATSANINPTPMIKLLASFSLSDPIRNSSSQNKNEMTLAYLKAFGGFRKN